MDRNSAIAKTACDLLAIEPNDAGVTLDLGDALAFLDKENGLICGRVEKVISLWKVTETIPNPTEIVGCFQEARFANAAAELAKILNSKFAGRIFAIDRLFYRKPKFGVFNRVNPLLPFKKRDSEISPSLLQKGLRWLGFARPDLQAIDIEFDSFWVETIDEALKWGNSESQAEEIQLWLQEDDGCAAAYVQLALRADQTIDVGVEDRICWPWRKSALQRRVKSLAEAKAAIRNYIVKEHGFQYNSISVTFFHQAKLLSDCSTDPVLQKGLGSLAYSALTANGSCNSGDDYSEGFLSTSV